MLEQSTTHAKRMRIRRLPHGKALAGSVFAQVLQRIERLDWAGLLPCGNGAQATKKRGPKYWGPVRDSTRAGPPTCAPRTPAMPRPFKIPRSVLVVIHTP